MDAFRCAPCARRFSVRRQLGEHLETVGHLIVLAHLRPKSEAGREDRTATPR